MKIEIIWIGIIKFCVLGVLTGCASTPELSQDQIAAAELSDESYDVLFATEFPVESEADALARAAQAMKDEEIDKALFFYVRALQFDPANVDLLSHIADIQMRRSNMVMAKRAYLFAKKHNPTHAPSLEGLGLIYMSEGMNAQAITELEAAVTHGEKRWRAHNALGVYEDKADEFAAALVHYDAALSINPNAAHVLNNRGYSKFLSGDYVGAVQDLYEAAYNRGFPQAWANLGKVYAAQGEYDDAISTYENVMSDAHAYNNTGEIALENGDTAEALRYLNEAIRLSPTYFPEAERNLQYLEKHN